MPKASISKYFSKKSHPPDSQIHEKPPIAISSPQIDSLSSLEIPEIYVARTATSSEDSDKDGIHHHLKKLRQTTLIAENRNDSDVSEDDSGNSTSHEQSVDPRLIQRMHNEDKKHKISEAHKVILEAGKPYPQIFSPDDSEFRTEGFDGSSTLLQDHLYPVVKIRPTSLKINDHLTALSTYRDHFRRKEHVNLIARDEVHGPVVISVKNEDEDNSWDDLLDRTSNEILDDFIKSSESQQQEVAKNYRVIIRTKQGIEDRRFTGYGNEPIKWFRMVHPEFRSVIHLKPVLSFKAWDEILKYDEHTLNNQYKFGLIYQKPNQTTEKEFFGNNEISPAFQEFLDLMGTTVKLKNFDKYAGGLDTKHNLTGEESLYTQFEDKEVMFHVSTMLPFSDGEQQLARKRHIGNDICAIAFQDENTTFIPGAISSQFLHCYCVVQPIEPNTPNCRYKVSTACKSGVKEFSPELPKPDGVFKKGQEFRKFLLCKLINAESAAYRSKQFQKLNSRTRAELLENLYEELNQPTTFSGVIEKDEDEQTPKKNSKYLKKRIFDNFKKSKDKKEYKSKSSHLKIEKNVISQPVQRKFQSSHVKFSNKDATLRKITFSPPSSNRSSAELAYSKQLQIDRLLKTPEKLHRKRSRSANNESMTSSKEDIGDSLFDTPSPMTLSDSTRHYSTGDLSNSSGSIDKIDFQRMPMRKYAIRRRHSDDHSESKMTSSSGSKCSACNDYNVPVSALEMELAMLRAEKEQWEREKMQLLGKLKQVQVKELDSYEDEILI